MLLKDKFYKVLSETRQDEQNAVYLCQLLPDCDVYRGHFPHKPVSPGVCNIEMIKECAMMLTGKSLQIKGIKQCRLTAIASPTVCPEVKVTVSVSATEDVYIVVANIANETQSFMDYKGEMTV
ncbi:MAG: beta-hydroxyacyl-ACP dehydratase [Bacteroidales bacterium]|nr:beta-hydroxyacyl-ACP dehydratase [Bacteroidales bacterium]